MRSTRGGSSVRVCVATGSRADFGLLKPVMTVIAAAEGLTLEVMVVGSHFLESQGSTISEIEASGFAINERVDVAFDDSASGVSEAIAKTVTGATAALTRLQPNIVILLGDRFEALAVGLASTILRIPIAHIGGGDVTLGAYDEGFRHSLTKLSHIHFTTNTESTQRVLQLGEEAWRVHQVGSPGIDALLEVERQDKETIEHFLSWSFRRRNLLVTLHPTTLQPGAARMHAQALVQALEGMPDDIGVIVTGTNIDNEGAEINDVLWLF